ncbi:uncharacterized protein BJ171DRAFT_528811 [Polychytrium aggregatum]|uniref:uncharacterized protein n=1 Tax=Polychytrium aggregatum TaxID=110093 RepID=UPI0022FEBA6B|nr:uncharacterized protein BJ171DRAFT_528811 [Polychytrium aggregatum]KAI9193301.1 hypothetical protein BJ171DRAFT_528811 [Polychytrium aggregatum]
MRFALLQNSLSLLQNRLAPQIRESASRWASYSTAASEQSIRRPESPAPTIPDTPGSALAQDPTSADAWNSRYVVHILANRNNTIATLAKRDDGKVICIGTAGLCGLRKAARGTSDAGYLAVLKMTELAAKKLGEDELKRASYHLKLKMFGPGREQAFRALQSVGWRISQITDVTPVRHGGSRPPKKRNL